MGQRYQNVCIMPTVLILSFEYEIMTYLYTEKK